MDLFGELNVVNIFYKSSFFFKKKLTTIYPKHIASFLMGPREYA